jgi:hypothetical protein
LTFAVNVDENDKQLIDRLANISIVCGKSQPSFLKNKSMRQTVLKCDELEGYIENQFKIRIETTGVQITPMAAQLAAAANEAVENNAAAAQ